MTASKNHSAEQYQRLAGRVAEVDHRTGAVRIDLGENIVPLHAAAFIGGPLRLPETGDSVLVSLTIDGMPVSARILKPMA